MIRSNLIPYLLACFVLGLTLSSCDSGGLKPTSKVQSPIKDTNVIQKANRVNWLTIEEAEKKMAIEPKDIYIMVYADWCSHCENFEATTYKHSKVIKDLNEKFYPVKINAHDTREITYRGKKFTNPDYDASIPKTKKNSFHEILYEIEARSVPSIVFINESFELTGSLMGFKEADELRSLMHMYKSK